MSREIDLRRRENDLKARVDTFAGPGALRQDCDRGLLRACRELLDRCRDLRLEFVEFLLASVPEADDRRFLVSAAVVFGSVLALPLTAGWSAPVAAVGLFDWLTRLGPAVKSENRMRRMARSLDILRNEQRRLEDLLSSP